MTAGRVRNRVPQLLKEAKADQMALVREAGVAISTAYRLADPEEDVRGVQFATIEKLCEFFSKRLRRKITPEDLFPLEESG